MDMLRDACCDAAGLWDVCFCFVRWSNLVYDYTHGFFLQPGAVLEMFCRVLARSIRTLERERIILWCMCCSYFLFFLF